MLKQRLVLAAALALCAAPLAGVQAADPAANRQADIRLFPRGAQEIIGQQVTGTGGQQLGEVRDVIIGANGQVEGVVLQHGGVAGVGGKRVAIDWNQFSVNPQGGLNINMDENQVAQLPDYEEGGRAIIESPPKPQ